MKEEAGTGTHRGRLWLVGDPSSAVDAEVTVSDDRLHITVAGDELGDWPRAAVRFRATDDGIHLAVEGEEVVFASSRPGLVDDLTPAGGLAGRIERAAASPPPPAPERSRHRQVRTAPAWWRRPPAVAAGVVLVLTGIAGLAAGTVGSPATTTQSTASPTTTVAEPIEEPATAGDTAAPERAEVEATVVRVVDGDTIRVLLPDGREEPVRLIGIDAPEQGDRLAPEATAFLTEMVEGRTVILVRDISDRDRFDRLLRYVYVDETFVNEEIVRAGLAVARRYPPDTAMAVPLEAAQEQARETGSGGWTPTTETTAAPGGAASTTPSSAVATTPSTAASTTSTSTATTTAVTSTTPRSDCDSSYPDVCIPPYPPDLDCGDIPYRRFRVVGPDPHGFDRDGDGIGCES